MSEFKFSYSGKLYGISKYISYNTHLSLSKLNYKGEKVQFYLKPYATYTGSPMDVIISDDLLLYLGKNSNNIVKLPDDDYYFSYIMFPNLYNGNNNRIDDNKYKVELYVRYAGEENFVKYTEFMNCHKEFFFTSTDKHIVNYYFKINDMNESIGSKTGYFNNDIIFKNNNNDLANGTIYNFANIQVYINGELQNTVPDSSYSSTLSQQYIKTYDNEKYGHNLQRDYISVSISEKEHILDAIKSMKSFTRNDALQRYETSFYTCGYLYDNSSYRYP